MRIIKLPVEEWKAYRDLRLRALKEDPQAFSSSYTDTAQLPEERWTGRLRDAQIGERSWLFFAKDQGKLVGMIGAFLDEADIRTAIIVSVYVPAEERGKGISSQLMDCILKELSTKPSLKAVALTVNETQIAAIRLYERFGFTSVSPLPDHAVDGDAVKEIAMKRSLPYSPAPR